MRTTILSTSNLKNYRTTIIVIDSLILMSVVYLMISMLHAGEGILSSLVIPVQYLVFHMYYPMFLKLKNISYDNSSIYYNKKGYEVQVPFEEIRSIEIKSLTGIYGIHLFTPSQGESIIYFKASAWYPFNFRKRDEMVNELRDKIDNYKRRLSSHYSEPLPGRRI